MAYYVIWIGHLQNHMSAQDFLDSWTTESIVCFPQNDKSAWLILLLGFGIDHKGTIETHSREKITSSHIVWILDKQDDSKNNLTY